MAYFNILFDPPTHGRSALPDGGGKNRSGNSSSLALRKLSGSSESGNQPHALLDKVGCDADDTVAVILAYYNGNRFLPAQVRSILNQSHRNLAVFICDNHSDIAVNIEALRLAPEEREKVYLGSRPANIGFAGNFLSALHEIGREFPYFAFSDQDDIWHVDKLSDALETLKKYPPDLPALYCARTRIVDENARVEKGNSRLFIKPPTFANALVQNIGGGNTMVFNKGARDLIVASSANVDVVYHDWWCYQIVSGAGGIVHYDPKPCLKYRQHGANLVGANRGLGAKLARVDGLLRGNFRNWNSANLKALSKNKGFLTPDNQKRLDDFITARKSGVLKRLFFSYRAGIHRQMLLDNIGLFLGLLINRI